MSGKILGEIVLPDQAAGKYLSDDGTFKTPPGGATVKSGIVAGLGANASANVMFTTPFSSVPRVVATSQFSSGDTSTTLSIHSVTVNGFTLRGAGNAAGDVAWIATDAGND